MEVLGEGLACTGVLPQPPLPGATVNERPEKCRGCPADTAPGTQGFVPPEGPQDARFVLIGQNPGEDEAALSRPFVGPSGHRLNRWLVKAGVPREQCAVGNVVWCRTVRKGVRGGWVNRTPTAAETRECWRRHTAPWLTSLKGKRMIVAVGIHAAKCFVPRAAQRTMGTIAATEHGYVVPIVHPSAIIQGQWEHDPVQPKFIRRAWEIAESGEPPVVPKDGEAPPNARTAHRVDEVAAFLGEVLRDEADVAADIEGVGGVLIGIGFTRIDDLRSMYVPFRDRAEPAWSAEDTRCVAAWVDRVLASEAVGKIFHNGSSFDLPFLEEVGFIVNGYIDDTLVRAWATYHEQQKDLQSLAILYAGLGAWKHLSHVGEEGDGK